MESGVTEEAYLQANALQPELFHVILDFDLPDEEISEAERRHRQWARAAELHEAEAEAERLQLEAQEAHDYSPLGSRFKDTNKQTREGGGLPEGSIIPCGITDDLVLQFDLPARRMEREERLLGFNGGDVNKTLEQICCEGGGKDARFLLANGADANHREEEENGVSVSVLERAATEGYLPVVEALLDAGADGTVGNALQWAGDGGHLAVVEALLDAGADEFDVFCHAAFTGNTAVVTLLLDRGVDVHHDDDQALFNAAREGHLEMVTLLLDRGAFTDDDILQVAVRKGHHAVADLLRTHGAAV